MEDGRQITMDKPKEPSYTTINHHHEIGIYRKIAVEHLVSFAHHMKNWFHEIRKGYLGGLGAALLAWTLAAIPSVPRLVLGLALTDTQVLYIRAGLALFGFAILAFVGWLLYFQTRRKLQVLETALSDAQKHPHRFQDDCTFDSRLGVYRFASTPDVFYCASCTPKDVRSPLKVQENGWMCQIRGCEKFHRNPDYTEPQHQPIYRTDDPRHPDFFGW
jgi:hypothetical protein